MGIIILNLGLLILAYLLGSLPFGLWVGKLWAKVDVREHGSGNIGVSNVLRTVGVVPAIIVLIFDAGKGLIPVLLAKQLVSNETMWIVIGIMAIVGHTWPLFLQFKGGRGVATAAGMLIGLSWQVILILLAVWIASLVITRYISLSSILAAISLPICLWILDFSASYLLLGSLLALLVVLRHIPNIKRLFAGEEYKIGEKARKS